jgi:4-amino-4-deoxy-L-arabinose transferase-like glycosyltransferase
MRWSGSILVLLLIFDVWYRAHTFAPDLRDRLGANLWPGTVGPSEPLDCDEAAYAYIGHRILHGDVLYRDLTENKTPLGYWLYALAVGLAGYDELAIRIMPVPFILATIAIVWWIAGRLAGKVSACVAAGLYVLLSTDPFLFGNGSNLEHFVNFFSVASLALVILGLGATSEMTSQDQDQMSLDLQSPRSEAPAWERSPRRSAASSASSAKIPPHPFRGLKNRSLLFAAGICLGGAALVKQFAIFPALIYVPALLLRPGQGDGSPARKLARALVDALTLLLGVAAIVLPAAAILFFQGAGRDAFDDIFLYARALATDTRPDPHAPWAGIRWITGNADPTGRLPWPFGTTDYLVWWGTASWPIWLASVPSLAYLLFGRGTTAERRLSAAWAVAAWAQVTLPGLYWQHYYLLPIAGAAIAVGVSFQSALSFVAGALQSSRSPASRQTTSNAGKGWRSIALAVVSIPVLAIAIAATVVLEVRSYLLVPPQELTIRYKGGGQWVILRRMGRELLGRAGIWNEPHLYIWGWQSPLHFYARLDSPTRHFFVDNLLRDQADRGHKLISRRTDEIMAALNHRPPELIFTGYQPFGDLRVFLNDRYIPSGIFKGLWIRQDTFARFERAGPVR